MADTSAIISSSGGIAAGSPFTLGAVLAVQQVSPPVAFTARLAFLADAEESIVAPGVLGGVTTFVIGRQVIDNGATGAILIGDTITQQGVVATSQNQTLIGRNFALAPTGTNCDNMVAIGSALIFTASVAKTSFGGSVVIGANGTAAICSGTADANNLVLIGESAKATGGSTVLIGQAATATDGNTVGIGCRVTVDKQAVALGFNASVAIQCIGIGANVQTGTHGVNIGYGSTSAGGDLSVAVGWNTDTSLGGGGVGRIAIGASVTVGSDNWCQIGSRTTPAAVLFFGGGQNDATGGNVYTFGVTGLFGGAGNNLPGNTLVIRAGNGTGNWPNAFGGPTLGIDLRCGLVQAGGSTVQPDTSVLALRHSDLNVAFWGGLSATFGLGVRAIFIGNAVTIPSVAPVGGCLLYVDPATGFVHILSANGVNTVIAL